MSNNRSVASLKVRQWTWKRRFVPELPKEIEFSVCLPFLFFFLSIYRSILGAPVFCTPSIIQQEQWIFYMVLVSSSIPYAFVPVSVYFLGQSNPTHSHTLLYHPLPLITFWILAKYLCSPPWRGFSKNVGLLSFYLKSWSPYSSFISWGGCDWLSCLWGCLFLLLALIGDYLSDSLLRLHLSALY